MKPLPFFSASFLATLALVLPPRSVAQASPDQTPQLTLRALVEAIVGHHPELKYYEAEIAAARAGRGTAARWTDPEVSLTLGHKRVQEPAGGGVSDGVAWSVAVVQDFDWPARRSLRRAIADREVELAELGLARFQNALAGRARMLAYGLHAAQIRADAVTEVAARFASLRENFLARDPAGITPLLETRVIEAAELSLQHRATKAQLALTSALIELNQLRGAEAEAALRIEASMPALRDAPDRASLLAAARRNNFEYRLRQAELEKQGYTARLTRHERIPSLSGGPFVSQENAGARETVIGLSLSLPIPVTGRNRSLAEVAEIRHRQAETASYLAERELEKDVLIAVESFNAYLRELRRWTSDAAGKFREAAALADRHYRLGAVPIATYVELQQSYLDAVESMLDTETDALAAALKIQELTAIDLVDTEAKP